MRAWRTTAAHLAGGELTFAADAVLRVDLDGVLYPKGEVAPWSPTPAHIARMALFPGRYEEVDVEPKAAPVEFQAVDPIFALERAVRELGHSKNPNEVRIASAVADAIRSTMTRIKAESEAEAKAAAPAPKPAKSKPAPATEPTPTSDAAPVGEKGP